MKLLTLQISSFLSALASPTIAIDHGHGGTNHKHKSDGSQKGNGSSWNNA